MDRQAMAMQLEVKKALSETILLRGGRYGFIISQYTEGGSEKWECHVCQKVFNTDRAMLTHLAHPTHLTNLRPSRHYPSNFRRKTTEEEVKKALEASRKKDGNTWGSSDIVDPGEPIPPGMEDVIRKVVHLQDTIDKHTGPLIGLEYIVELVSPDAEPKYICLLCEKKGDPRSVMVHLTSHNHNLKYISCFFRSAGNALNMIPKVPENRKGVNIAVAKITEEIQRIFGRLKPTSAVAETFSQHKYEILRNIDENQHFRETSSTMFVEYCTMEKIREFARFADNDAASKVPKILTVEDPTTVKENNSNNANNTSNNNNKETKPPNQPNPTPHIISQPPVKYPDGKLSFSIGKPERSFGRNKPGESNKSDDKKDDDDVIILDVNDEPIEIRSLSSISSASDHEGRKTSHYPRRSRSRSRGRGGRGRSPHRHRSKSPRRRSSDGTHRGRDRGGRYKSRSRTRSPRGRYHNDRDRDHRREVDRFGRVKRSHSRERRSRSRERKSRSRDRARIERRFRRSRSMEDRRSPQYPYRKYGKSPRRSPPPKSKYSPERKKKKPATEYECKMDAYRSKLHELEVEMDSKLKYYKERPEKHPQYSDEWKSFWNRRYKELQQSGQDPTGYDFKPEWIVFWDERVKQLHEEELALKKEELKELLPKGDKGPSSDLQDVSPPTPENAKDITVDDIKNTWKALTGTDIKAPNRGRSPSPDTRSSHGRRSPSPWEDYNRRHKKGGTYTADPPIVHCLRMLSVIEQQLGSLGPKALDLLSKAILMEKIKHNESMQMLQDPETHIFFETVKEKVRGQLIAGIVQRFLVNSCRMIISTIEGMLASHPLKPKPLPQSQPKPAYTPLQPEPVKVEGVGLVNKMAVAQQIAEILVSQGKTDVSQQELEDLINAVVGIASTSNANVNQPSAQFISQLNIQNSTATPRINELLSNLISSAQKCINTTQPIPPTIETPPVLPHKTEVYPESSTVPAASVTPSASVPAMIAQNSSQAFSEAVTAAKATVSQQASVTPKPSTLTAAQEKPLFPIKDPIKEPLVEKDVEIKETQSQVSDEALKERLLKFKTLSREEQQSLISLLKELEGKEPLRVEKLRKYVTTGLAQPPVNSTPPKPKPEIEKTRLSPFSSRAGGTNPAPGEKNKPILEESDNEDDDDYTVDDIYKSVSEKLKKNEPVKLDPKPNPAEHLDENSSSSHFSNPGQYSVSQHQDLPKQIPQLNPRGNSGWPKGMFMTQVGGDHQERQYPHTNNQQQYSVAPPVPEYGQQQQQYLGSNSEPGYRLPGQNPFPGYRPPGHNLDQGYRPPGHNLDPGYQTQGNIPGPGYQARGYQNNRPFYSSYNQQPPPSNFYQQGPPSYGNYRQY